jgi:RecB family exonuclease
MYVAVTRARKTLEVSAGLCGASGNKQALSPFVSELFGDELPELEGDQDTGINTENVIKKLQRYYPLRSENKGLPFETSDGWIELGVTSLGSYEYCPFEFYLQNVLQIRQPLGPQLAFGNALHAVFEQYYRGVLSQDMRSRSELHGVLDELWSDRGYDRREVADADRQLAHRTLDSFIDREAQVERTIVATEMPIRFELPEAKLRLRGKIDAVFETNEGVELRDFKTGRTKTDREKLAKEAKANFQLRTYALAYQALNGLAPAGVTLDYVVTGVEGEAALTAAILRNHREKLRTLADSIRNREFAPNPSPHHECAAIRYYGTGEQDELFDEVMRREAHEAR